MKARRRRPDGQRNRRTRTQDNASRGNPSRGSSSRSGRKRKGSRRSESSASAEARQRDERAFWGTKEALPPARADVRISDTPAAVASSLGPPPLPGHEAIAQHYFEAVYGRAVTTAGALAAAGGLIDPDALTDDAT